MEETLGEYVCEGISVVGNWKWSGMFQCLRTCTWNVAPTFTSASMLAGGLSMINAVHMKVRKEVQTPCDIRFHFL